MTDTEARNQMGAVDMMFEALSEAREHAKRGLREAQEAVEAFETILNAIPEGASPETHNLNAVGAMLAVATDAGLAAISCDHLRTCVHKTDGHLSEADGQHDYLIAGDFSE